MQYTFLASAALLGAVANAADHVVQLKKDTFVFSPSTLDNVAKGDTVSFQIGDDHNVQQGDFSSPCVTSSDGFSSGKSVSGDTQTFRVTINSTDPIYAFCGEPGHCQQGMTFVINAPSSSNASAYNSAAKKTTSSKPSSDLRGGQLVRAGSSGSSSSSSGGSSSSTSSAGSSSGSSSPTSSGASSSGSAASAAPSSSSSGIAAPGAQGQQGLVTSAVMALAGFMAYFL